MFKLKKVVDERQELELLKIEKMGFWMLYWMLFASFIIQSLFMDVPSSQYEGELIVFLAASVYVSIACFRKGEWDYCSKPGLKSYLIYSLLGSGVFTILFGISKYMKYAAVRENIWAMGLPIVAIMFVFTFGLIFVTLAIFGHAVKKRRAKLEKELDCDLD